MKGSIALATLMVMMLSARPSSVEAQSTVVRHPPLPATILARPRISHRSVWRLATRASTTTRFILNHPIPRTSASARRLTRQASSSVCRYAV
jgi:hypothetical protein